MAIDADVSELVAFGADLLGLAATAVPRVAPIIERGAVNIKTTMTADLRSSPAFKGTARSVSYDVRGYTHGLAVEIGPDKERRGGLANVAYFGGARGGGGTVRDPVLALADELPTLLRYLGDLVEEI